MIKYSKIIILLHNVICINAFILTQVNKMYFPNTRHVRKYNIFSTYQANNTNNSINQAFPSFYEFLRKRDPEFDPEFDPDVETIEAIKEDFNKFKETINETIKEPYKDNNFVKSLNSKNLKLLTSFSAIQWARTWIYEMVHISEFFPTFMYQDMYKLCDYGCVNVSKRFFYIGYYPSKIDQRKGPYYIGAFEINPKEREFITRIIIQNPYYCVENSYTKEDILNFKIELQALCNEASVFFKFSNLKNTSFERYYYSWLYEE